MRYIRCVQCNLFVLTVVLHALRTLCALHEIFRKHLVLCVICMTFGFKPPLNPDCVFIVSFIVNSSIFNPGYCKVWSENAHSAKYVQSKMPYLKCCQDKMPLVNKKLMKSLEK